MQTWQIENKQRQLSWQCSTYNLELNFLFDDFVARVHVGAKLVYS